MMQCYCRRDCDGTADARSIRGAIDKIALRLGKNHECTCKVSDRRKRVS